MAEFIIILGFLIVLIIEQVVLDFKERWRNESTIETVHAVNIDVTNHTIPENSSDETETSRLLESPDEKILNIDAENATTNGRQYYGKSHKSKNYGSTSSSSTCKGKSLETRKAIERFGTSLERLLRLVKQGCFAVGSFVQT